MIQIPSCFATTIFTIDGSQTFLDQTESVVEGWQDVLVTGNNHIWSGSGSSQSGESDESNDGHAGTAEP